MSVALLCLSYVIATIDPLERLIENVKFSSSSAEPKLKVFLFAAIVDAAWKFSLLLVGEAAAARNHASLYFQHNERRGISKRNGQEAKSRRGWALRLSVESQSNLLFISVVKF